MVKQDSISLVRLFLTPNITSYIIKNFLKKYDYKVSLVLEVINKEKKYILCSVMQAENYLNECLKKNIKIITILDKEYPKKLISLSTSPVLLHCKGEVGLLNKDILAVVGSRNASLQGVSLTKQIVSKISAKYTIASGLARGIDTAAHENALSNTIAVLGSGINFIYPLENKKLYESIIENKSLIISEYNINQESRPHLFSYRNRLISGLARGVLVMEAGSKSGSLVTAKFALDQGKDIFAVPGHPYDIRMQGSNYLIKNGAIMLQNADDVFNYYSKTFEEIDLFKEEEETMEEEYDFETFKDIEELILSKLSYVKISVEDIINLLPYKSEEIKSALGALELKNKIINSYGMICKV